MYITVVVGAGLVMVGVVGLLGVLDLILLASATKLIFVIGVLGNLGGVYFCVWSLLGVDFGRGDLTGVLVTGLVCLLGVDINESSPRPSRSLSLSREVEGVKVTSSSLLETSLMPTISLLLARRVERPKVKLTSSLLSLSLSET